MLLTSSSVKELQYLHFLIRLRDVLSNYYTVSISASIQNHNSYIGWGLCIVRCSGMRPALWEVDVFPSSWETVWSYLLGLIPSEIAVPSELVLLQRVP